MSEGTEKLVGENGSPVKDDPSPEKHSEKSEHRSLSESRSHKHKIKDHSDEKLNESTGSSRRKHHTNSDASGRILFISFYLLIFLFYEQNSYSIAFPLY